jgi:probable rRNA maturation factor
MTEITLIVDREAGAWPPDAEARARAAASAALTAALTTQAALVEVGVTLADDAIVQELNRDHRDQDKPTNVLSFPLCDQCDENGALEADGPGAPLLLGDVILAWETVAGEATAQGKPVLDHTAHLVVHGVLHLLGHDHDTDEEAEAMERLEVAIVATLGIPDPYAAPYANPEPQ